MPMFAYRYLFLFFSCATIYSNQFISETPIAVAYSPKCFDSTVSPDILYAGERPRYSSCSGVVWVPGDKYLISVHLFSGTLATYIFDKTIPALTPIRCLRNIEGLLLKYPENLEISPNGKWLAISQGKGTLDLFALNTTTAEVRPTYTSLRYSNHDWVHGVTFSNDGLFLASTSIGPSSCICIYKLINGQFKIHQVLENRIRPLEPKSIAFSPENKFLAACYCQTIGTNKTPDPKAQLEIYRFNQDSQLFNPNPVSIFTKIPGNMETVKFSPDASYLLTSDQALDEIFLHKFDMKTGTLSNSEVLLKNPNAELNFPHGLAFSKDGQYLAVTNYGDDRITIYQIKNTKVP